MSFAALVDHCPTDNPSSIDRYEEGSENEVHLLALHSPRGAGAKRIVVDPSLYVAQPCDIVTDSWVADNTMRLVVARIRSSRMF